LVFMEGPEGGKNRKREGEKSADYKEHGGSPKARPLAAQKNLRITLRPSTRNKRKRNYYSGKTITIDKEKQAL